MSMITIEDKQTHMQIIKRAETELGLLITEHQEIQVRLQSIAAELETLQQRGQARQELLTTSRTTLEQARNAHTQATTQAKLSEGMMTHADAVKAANHAAKTLQRIERESSEIEQRCAGESSADQARMEMLQAERMSKSERLGAIQQERLSLQQAKEQAHAAIGDLEYHAVCEQITEIRGQIETKGAELADLEERLQQTIQSGIVALSSWGTLQQQIRQELPPVQDAVTMTLQAQLAVIDALTSNAQHLMPLTRLRSADAFYHNWRHLFVLSPDALSYIGTWRDDPRELMRQRALIQHTLDEYRQHGR